VATKVVSASDMLKLYGQLGKPSHGPKTKIAQKVYADLRASNRPLVVRRTYKAEDYKGYHIRVYEELVKDAGHSCHIYDGAGEPVAHRRGLDAAKAYIDTLFDARPRCIIRAYFAVPVTTKVTIRMQFRKG